MIEEQNDMKEGEILEQFFPTGGGKTSSALQMGFVNAIAGKHTLVMLFEQYYDEYIQERITGLATGASRDTIRAVMEGTGEFTKEEKDKYNVNMPLVSEYMHVVDRYADPDKTADTVEEVLKEGVSGCRHTGGIPLDPKQLDTIILDWWGALLTRIKIPGVDKGGIEMSAKEQLKTFIRDLGVRVVLMVV